MRQQLYEILIIDGEPNFMASFPSLPDDHPGLRELDPAEAIHALGMASPGRCSRGYVATWEIRYDQLLLAGVQGKYHMDGVGPLPADWVSGLLRVPQGQPRWFLDGAGDLQYDQELHLVVELGRVTEWYLTGGVAPRKAGTGAGHRHC